MFTGITESVGFIKNISKIEPLEYKIENSHAFNRCKNRSSIMCSGICLTVIKKTKNSFSVNISEETLHVTTAINWKKEL